MSEIPLRWLNYSKTFTQGQSCSNGDKSNMAAHTDDSQASVVLWVCALTARVLTTDHRSRHGPSSKMVLMAGGCSHWSRVRKINQRTFSSLKHVYICLYSLNVLRIDRQCWLLAASYCLSDFVLQIYGFIRKLVCAVEGFWITGSARLTFWDIKIYLSDTYKQTVWVWQITAACVRGV